MRACLSCDEFAAAIRSGSLPPEYELRKTYSVVGAVKAIEPDASGAPRFRFAISSEAVDRDRDVISLSGWKTASYRANPIVLWAHMSRDLPVARSEREWVEGGKLLSEAVWPEKDAYPFADTVAALLKGGFLNATSVGFVPMTWSYDEQRRGYNFTEAELLEYSIVPIPSNPDALVQARGAGIDVRPIKAWAERVLDECRALDVGVTPEQAAAAVKAADPTQAVSVAVPALLVSEPVLSASFDASFDALAKAIADAMLPIKVSVDALTEKIAQTFDDVAATAADAEPADNKTAPPDPRPVTSAPPVASASDAPPKAVQADDLDAMLAALSAVPVTARATGTADAAPAVPTASESIDPQDDLLRRAIADSVAEGLAVARGKVPDVLTLRETR